MSGHNGRTQSPPGASNVRSISKSTQPNPTTGLNFLDSLLQRLSDESKPVEYFDVGMDELIHFLRSQRIACEPEQWKEFVALFRQHPIRWLLHQDPFTYRAFTKPRGYAGDAIMLDYIYGREENWPLPDASTMGLKVFRYTTRSPSTEGVRARRGFAADLIDKLSSRIKRPSILSIASGHLREASLMSSLKRRRLGRFVAFDADGESLEEVRRTYGCFGVETETANIRQLFSSKLDLGKFDLVYSTGLFDYVGPAAARRLVSRMFDMLLPGGRLMVANFLPAVRDVGYMETFMDWNLIYRTRHEMIDITMEIPQEEIEQIKLFAEENQNVIFVVVTKRE